MAFRINLAVLLVGIAAFTLGAIALIAGALGQPVPVSMLAVHALAFFGMSAVLGAGVSAYINAQ